MVTIQTLGFQPLTINFIEKYIPAGGGVFILARRTAAMQLKPYLVRKSQNIREALRAFFHREPGCSEPEARQRSAEDRNNRLWVRIISIEGDNHRSEIEKILTQELLGDDAGTSGDGTST